MTARLDLAIQLDEWRQSLDHPMPILQHFDAIVWLPETLHSMRWSLILSTHYYFTCLLSKAPVLVMGLAETQKHLPLDAPPSVLQGAIGQILQGDFEAAKNLQTLIQGLHSLGGLFINENAIWFLCNYSSMCHCWN